MADTQSRSVSEESFAGLAHRIAAWTTNLLATAIVFALGLAIGCQVLIWWRDSSRPSAVNHSEADLAGAFPFALGDHEFWTKHGSLRIERVTGDESLALAAMRGYCRSIVPDKTTTMSALGPSEQRLLQQFHQQACLEESGDLATYRPPGQRLMVAAMSRSQGRIVGWSFALPAGERAWSLYHFQPLAREGEAPAEPSNARSGARP